MHQPDRTEQVHRAEQAAEKAQVSLLNSVHKYNVRIDCLDYFIHTLEKSQEVLV